MGFGLGNLIFDLLQALEQDCRNAAALLTSGQHQIDKRLRDAFDNRCAQCCFCCSGHRLVALLKHSLETENAIEGRRRGSNLAGHFAHGRQHGGQRLLVDQHVPACPIAFNREIAGNGAARNHLADQLADFTLQCIETGRQAQPYV